MEMWKFTLTVRKRDGGGRGIQGNNAWAKVTKVTAKMGEAPCQLMRQSSVF